VYHEHHLVDVSLSASSFVKTYLVHLGAIRCSSHLWADISSHSANRTRPNKLPSEVKFNPMKHAYSSTAHCYPMYPVSAPQIVSEGPIRYSYPPPWALRDPPIATRQEHGAIATPTFQMPPTSVIDAVSRKNSPTAMSICLYQACG